MSTVNEYYTLSREERYTLEKELNEKLKVLAQLRVIDNIVDKVHKYKHSYSDVYYPKCERFIIPQLLLEHNKLKMIEKTIEIEVTVPMNGDDPIEKGIHISPCSENLEQDLKWNDLNINLYNWETEGWTIEGDHHGLSINKVIDYTAICYQSIFDTSDDNDDDDNDDNDDEDEDDDNDNNDDE